MSLVGIRTMQDGKRLGRCPKRNAVTVRAFSNRAVHNERNTADDGLIQVQGQRVMCSVRDRPWMDSIRPNTRFSLIQLPRVRLSPFCRNNHAPFILFFLSSLWTTTLFPSRNAQISPLLRRKGSIRRNEILSPVFISGVMLRPRTFSSRSLPDCFQTSKAAEMYSEMFLDVICLYISPCTRRLATMVKSKASRIPFALKSPAAG